MSRRSPPLYCTLTLIAMQGHQKNINNTPETMQYTITDGNSNIHYKGCKYKATTWYLNGFPTGGNLGSTVSRLWSEREEQGDAKKQFAEDGTGRGS